MGVKVSKFGGSSLADAAQFRKVKAILTSDPDRRIAVPSAPGKRAATDVKVTDLLYECNRLASAGKDIEPAFEKIRARFHGIAEELGIPSESGLAMLVGQARFSSELFQGHAIEDEFLEKIEDELRSLTRNVVLIGMPGAGKTSCGKRLARMLGRPFVDIDEAILADTGRSAAQSIQEDGEDAFRRVETEVTASYCKRSGMVIACGGGVVTRPQNRDLLRQNGRVVLVDRPLDELSDKGRPVSQAKGVERLAAERMHLYHEWADVILRCTGSAQSDAELVKELLRL